MSRARMMGMGKPTIMEYRLMPSVFLIRRPKYSDLKNWVKYLKPTHLLPVMPSTGEKSRKAICAPYMGAYMNTIYQIRAGSSIKSR